jgi:hypothetical protein
MAEITTIVFTVIHDYAEYRVTAEKNTDDTWSIDDYERVEDGVGELPNPAGTLVRETLDLLEHEDYWQDKHDRGLA